MPFLSLPAPVIGLILSFSSKKQLRDLTQVSKSWREEANNLLWHSIQLELCDQFYPFMPHILSQTFYDGLPVSRSSIHSSVSLTSPGRHIRNLSIADDDLRCSTILAKDICILFQSGNLRAIESLSLSSINGIDNILPVLSVHCPALKALELSYSNVDEGGAWENFWSFRGPQLTNLSLDSCEFLGEQTLEMISRSCPNLESLLLSNYNASGREMWNKLIQIARNCTHLSRFGISLRSRASILYSEDDAHPIFKFLEASKTRFTSLQLFDAVPVSEFLLDTISQLCPKLEKLGVSSADTCISPEWISRTLMRCRSLSLIGGNIASGVAESTSFWMSRREALTIARNQSADNIKVLA